MEFAFENKSFKISVKARFTLATILWASLILFPVNDPVPTDEASNAPLPKTAEGSPTLHPELPLPPYPKFEPAEREHPLDAESGAQKRPHLAKIRPPLGYYYEAVPEEQGDGEGRIILRARPCDPKKAMPIACYYPPGERKRLPVYPD